jgi:hypothetical protein
MSELHGIDKPREHDVSPPAPDIPSPTSSPETSRSETTDAEARFTRTDENTSADQRADDKPDATPVNEPSFTRAGETSELVSDSVEVLPGQTEPTFDRVGEPDRIPIPEPQSYQGDHVSHPVEQDRAVTSDTGTDSLYFDEPPTLERRQDANDERGTQPEQPGPHLRNDVAPAAPNGFEPDMPDDRAQPGAETTRIQPGTGGAEPSDTSAFPDAPSSLDQNDGPPQLTTDADRTDDAKAASQALPDAPSEPLSASAPDSGAATDEPSEQHDSMQEDADASDTNTDTEATTDAATGVDIVCTADVSVSEPIDAQQRSDFATYRDQLAGEGRTRTADEHGEAYDYQRQWCGDVEYRITPDEDLPKAAWADGLNDELALAQDAKFVRVDSRSSWFIPDTLDPDIAGFAERRMDKRLIKYGEAINNPDNPIRGLEIIVNSPEAARFIAARMNALHIPGIVRIRQ